MKNTKFTIISILSLLASFQPSYAVDLPEEKLLYRDILNSDFNLNKDDSPVARSMLYNTRSNTPTISWQGAYSQNGMFYEDGDNFWIKVGASFGLGVSSYLPRSSGLYPNYAQIDLRDGTTSRIITSDYNGTTVSYSANDNFKAHMSLNGATSSWNNDNLWGHNSLDARFTVVPNSHGKVYEIWSRSARGNNVTDWTNSGRKVLTDGVGPTVTFTNDKPTEWISADSYTLKTSVVDADSGANRQRYFTTGAQAMSDWAEGTLNMSITVNKQGRTAVSILGIDNVSNSSQANTYVLLDNQKPTVTVSGNPTSATTGNVKLTAKFSDNTNGGGINYIVLPDGTKKTIAADTFETSIDYTVSENNTYTFKVYDMAGNSNSVDVKVTNIIEEEATASITSTTYDTYTITVKNIPSDTAYVCFPTWTPASEQSDLISHRVVPTSKSSFSFTINRADYELGNTSFATDVYVENSKGERKLVKRLEHTFNAITSKVISSDSNKYSVSVYNIPSKVSLVEFPTWTKGNGQDDLIWHKGTNKGNGEWSFTVNRSDHKNEKGIYITNIYAVANNTRRSTKTGVTHDFTIPLSNRKIDIVGTTPNYTYKLNDSYIYVKPDKGEFIIEYYAETDTYQPYYRPDSNYFYVYSGTTLTQKLQLRMAMADIGKADSYAFTLNNGGIGKVIGTYMARNNQDLYSQSTRVRAQIAFSAKDKTYTILPHSEIYIEDKFSDDDYFYTSTSINSNNGITVVTDGTAPTVNFSPFSSEVLTNNVPVTIKPTDSSSGLKSWQYRLSSDGGKSWGDWSDVQPLTGYTVNLTTSGLIQIEVKAIDNVGNETIVKSGTYNIEDAVNIPDPNLRAGIEAILQKSSGAPIYKSELATIKNIILKNKHIVNLEGLQHCTSLRLLELPNNKVEDLTPIINLPALELVYFPDNLLTDSAVAKLKSLPVATTFVLNGNKLTKVPDFMLTSKKITHLNLDNNNISGSIPKALGNVTSLVDLRLSENNFTGSIPAEFGNLKNLQCLWLSFNNLSGSIPKELGNMTKLVDLMLHNNSLSGSIPSELSNAKNLRILSFKNNKLTGTIPSAVASMTLDKTTGSRYGGTYYTDFTNNLLIGDIPSTILSKIDKSRFDLNLFKNGTTNQKQLTLTGETSCEIVIEDILDVNSVKNRLKIKSTIDSKTVNEDIPSVYTIVDLNRDSKYLSSTYEALDGGTTTLSFGIKDYYTNNTYATTNNKLSITITIPTIMLDVGNFREFEYTDPNNSNIYWVKVGDSFRLEINSFMFKTSGRYPRINKINLKDVTTSVSVDRIATTTHKNNVTSFESSTEFNADFTLNNVVNDIAQTKDYNWVISYFTMTPKVHGKTYEGWFTGGIGSTFHTWKATTGTQKIKTDGQAPTAGTPTFTVGKGQFEATIKNITDNNQSGIKNVTFKIYKTSKPSETIEIVQNFTNNGGTLTKKFDMTNLGNVYAPDNRDYTIEITYTDNVGNVSSKTTHSVTVIPDVEPENIKIYVMDRDKYPAHTDGYHPYKNGTTYWVRKNGDFSVYMESSLPAKLVDLYPDTSKIILNYSGKGSNVIITSSGVTTGGEFTNNFKFKSDFTNSTLSIKNGFNFSKEINSTNNNRYSKTTARIEATVDGRTYALKGTAGYMETYAEVVDSGMVIKVDGGKPIITGVEDKDWSNTNITINISATDSQSGMRALELYDKATGAKLTSGVNSISYENTKEGIREFTVKAIDQVGNIETKNFIHKIDKTKPNKLTFNPYEKDWTNEAIVVTWLGEDGLSGVKEYSYQVTTVKNGTTSTTVNWTPYSADNTTYTVKTEGISTIKVKVKDKAGNEETFTSGEYKYDKTKPNKLTFNPYEKDWTNEAIAVSWSGTDALSGVNEYSYRITTKHKNVTTVSIDWTEYKLTNTSTTINFNGENTIEVKVKDKAGNEQTFKSGIYKYDDIKPVGSFTTNPVVTSRDITINISSLVDEHSKVSHIFVSNYSDFKNYSEFSVVGKESDSVPFTINKGNTVETNYGERTVYVKLFDIATNYSTYELKIWLDPKKPGNPTIVKPYSNNPLYLTGSVVKLVWEHKNGDNEFILPQTKATITLYNEDLKETTVYIVDGDIPELLIPGLKNGQYTVTITTNNFGPHTSNTSTIRFRYNKFNSSGLVRSVIISPGSKFRYVAVSTLAEIPEGCSVEGKIYYEQKLDGTMDTSKFVNFEISANGKKKIIKLDKHISIIQVDLILQGCNDEYISPVLDDIKVFAK